ncbi:MAG: glycosyltransferase [Clostridiales bacterium]|nr:glycosyltransferase [Clostridiales bacterium]
MECQAEEIKEIKVSENSSPKVSVIIPVCNVERYLGECLDSLLAQTFSDFEIICVDDGSTDSSRSILWEYAARDARIRVLEQNNLTAGVARNRGLSVAQGEYVIFLDGDDFFAPELLESTYQAAVDNQADVVLFDGKRYDSAKEQILENTHFLRRDLVPIASVFSRRDIPDNIYRIINPAPWTKLFSRAFLISTGLQFQALPNANDFYFILAALALADRICAVKEDLVYYRINAKTSTQSGKHRDPLCFLKAITALYDLLNDRGVYEEIKNAFTHIALSTTLYNLRTVQTDQARWNILDALGQENVLRMGLLSIEMEENEENDVKRLAKKMAQSVSSAVIQYERTKATWKMEPPQLVVPYRADIPALVSVLVPVYNAAPYLNQTLSSLTDQSLREIEIICINDGSTDDSLDVLRQWAERDSRISVYTQKNMGQACSRDFAIQAATGEYIYFMDSDDWLEPDALEQLYDRASRDRLDVVYFDAVSFFEDESLCDEHAALANSYIRSDSYDQVYDGPSLFTMLQFKGEYYPSPCLQFLRRGFVCEHKLQFHVGTIHEDNAFTFAAILNAKRVSHIHRSFFHRRIHSKSTMTTQISFRNSYGYFAGYVDMFHTFLEVEPKLNQDAHAAAENRLCTILRNAQDCYRKMPVEQWDSELGLGTDYRLFYDLVRRPAELQLNDAQFREIKERLQREKSELNRKLQITYDEKFDRGVQIKELKAQLKASKKAQADLKRQLGQTKKQLKAAKKQNTAIKRSASYRLGRILTWPVRKLKGLLKGLRKGKKQN